MSSKQRKLRVETVKKKVKGKDFDMQKYEEAESFCKSDIQNDEHKDSHKLLNVLGEFEAVIAND